MNTAVARRLALGDRVVWIGKDDCQPSGPGTITRITAHQVEVLWEDETASRYRRAQLHNLRHPKLICRAQWRVEAEAAEEARSLLCAVAGYRCDIGDGSRECTSRVSIVTAIHSCSGRRSWLPPSPTDIPLVAC